MWKDLSFYFFRTSSGSGKQPWVSVRGSSWEPPFRCKVQRRAAKTFHGRVWSEQQLAAVGRCTLLQQRASSAGLELHCPSVSHRLTFKACHFTGRPAASNPTWQLSSSMTPGNLFSQTHSRQRHYRSIKVISRRPDKMSEWISKKKLPSAHVLPRGKSQNCWSKKEERHRKVFMLNSCTKEMINLKKNVKNKVP